MARKKNVNKKPRISESYISLILGFFVVLAASFLLILFAKNRTYDKINTAISIFEEPQKTAQTEDKSKIYEVKTGDNLWSIAEKAYGSGYNWVDLAKENKIENPGIIFAGAKLKVPQVQKIVVQNPQTQISDSDQSKSITTSSYKIQEGDYLWDISIRKYGDGYKWPEIARINSIPNPDLIYANNVLKLP